MAPRVIDETFTAPRRAWLLPAQRARVLVNGFQSWSEAGLHDIEQTQPRPTREDLTRQGHDAAWPPSGQAGVWRSHTLIAVIDADGSGWVGCALRETRSFAHWEARATKDGVELRYESEGDSEGARLTWSEHPARLVEDMAAALGRNMRARTPAPLRVWCSWYSYYTNISASRMLENARTARHLDLPFDVFQLDDGYQTHLGDWTDARPSYGGHARDLPAHLADLGFRAGLWLAPFAAEGKSHLYARHPEFFLRDEHGAPVPCGPNWDGQYYALDTTRDDVQDWLRALARTVTGWGYSYLKIDFLFAATLPGRRARDVSRAEAYRMGLQAIRDGAGDAFILACGAPLASSAGLVDAMRTGPDVAPLWDDHARRTWLQDGTGPAARNAIHTSLARWYQHHWYQPDPDVMIARREQSLLTDTERGALLGLLDVTGGLRASSDPLARLAPDDVTLLRRALDLSAPDQPTGLRDTWGETVTHFQRGRFNLTAHAIDGVAPHAFDRAAPPTPLGGGRIARVPDATSD